MKKRNIIVILSATLYLVVLLFTSATAQESKKITYTTLDLSQGYEIVGIISSFARVETAVFKDPFEGAWKDAWLSFEKSATQVEADAVVGVRVDFENITEKNVGRLIIYGTAVKLKAP